MNEDYPVEGAEEMKNMESMVEMENLKELIQTLMEALGDENNFKEQPVSVEVEADSPEGLEEGLELAKSVVPGEEEEEMDPALEGLEEELHTDLDGDNEEGEDPSHVEAVLGNASGLDAIGDEEELKKAVLARLMRK